jgi:small subunit ribosomal protein S7e
MCSYLDPKEQNLLEYKLDTFSSVYRALAGKDVHFEYVQRSNPANCV